MANITMAADSTTVVLNGYAFNSLVSGDIIEMAPVNELTSHVNGTNGSVNINKRSDGSVYNLTIRTMRYSDDDIFLNSSVNQVEPVIFNGSIKENFIKNGVDSIESWVLENGSITTLPTEVKNDMEGNALMEYVIMFRNAQRNL